MGIFGRFDKGLMDGRWRGLLRFRRPSPKIHNSASRAEGRGR